MADTGGDLRWRLPLGVHVAFSTRADGDVRDPQRRQAWLGGLGVSGTAVVVRQVHGARVVPAVPGPAADADGLTTARPGPPLVVFGADCPGVCLAAPDALGMAHCGWRGVAGGMVAALVESLAARSRHPRSAWQAFVGPGVHPDDYEVDGPVLTARAWPGSALRPARPDRARLDLPAAIAADLAACGVAVVTCATQSTSRDGRLWSYRTHGEGLVQGLAAWWE
jgi:copper oxidase (laccase) domain-containing protein